MGAAAMGTVLLILLSVCYGHPQISHTKKLGCPRNRYDCGDGTCIFRSRICDNRPDCHDGRDEDMCGGVNQHHTRGRCLSEEFHVRTARASTARRCVIASLTVLT